MEETSINNEQAFNAMLKKMNVEIKEETSKDILLELKRLNSSINTIKKYLKFFVVIGLVGLVLSVIFGL
jgi:hypothetical protein